MARQEEMRINILMTGWLIIYMCLVHCACAPVLVVHDNWKYVQNYALGAYLHLAGFYIYGLALSMDIAQRKFWIMLTFYMMLDTRVLLTLGIFFKGAHWLFCSDASPLADRDDWLQWFLITAPSLLPAYFFTQINEEIYNIIRTV